jgi:hypothetical protein
VKLEFAISEIGEHGAPALGSQIDSEIAAIHHVFGVYRRGESLRDELVNLLGISRIYTRSR